MTAWMCAGKTAVITGAAGGIGLETARRFVQAGMNIAIADVKAAELKQAHAELVTLSGNEARVLSQKCDVTSQEALAAFRDAVLERFGKIHCLMNNAGIISRGTAPWEAMDALKQIMNINLMGVINGCHIFIPAMLAHGEAGAVINTSSKQGITRPPGNYAYNLSKAGVLAYTEALAHGFVSTENCCLRAHVLIPAFVYTPMIAQFMPEKPAFAATTEETVDYFMAALARDEFYIICPDNETNRALDEKRIQWSVDDIIKNRPAMSRWHPDYADEYKAYMETDND